MIPSSGEKSEFCFDAIRRRGGSTVGVRGLLTRDDAASCNRRTAEGGTLIGPGRTEVYSFLTDCDSRFPTPLEHKELASVMRKVIGHGPPMRSFTARSKALRPGCRRACRFG